MSEYYEIYGLDPSYFTQKVLGFFSFKGIPFHYHRKTFLKAPELEKNAGTHLIPVVKLPDDSWLYDSTPLALEMDKRFTFRQLLPDDKPLSFVVRLIEDYFDEWFTRPAVYYRWHYAADREYGGGAIVRNIMGLAAEDEIDPTQQGVFDQIFATIEKWALGKCDIIAAGAGDKDGLEAEFLRMMTLLDTHFAEHDFFLGARPCLADFSLYGALKAHFIHDPTPLAILQQHAPHLLTYVDKLEQSFSNGEEPAWPDYDGALPASLLAILAEISDNFHNFVALNKKAMAAGEEYVNCELTGYGQCKMIARKYTEQCRTELADVLGTLNNSEREKLHILLQNTDILEVY